METDMATDIATPSVQSLIDKFEQLAARSSGRPAPVASGPRRCRARCLSDCSLAFSSCDDLALRRHIPAKLSMDMTSTTSTTSISSDDDEDDAVDVDVGVDECDEQMSVEQAVDAEEKPYTEDDSDNSVTVHNDAFEQLTSVPEAQDNQQELRELEPPIVPVTLPPIDETAPELEQTSDADEPESEVPALTIDCSEESHDADCACSRCWLRKSVEHKTLALTHDTTDRHHDAPLTLEDLCTLHVVSSRSSGAALAPAATKPLQPSRIPQPRLYAAARRVSLGPSALSSPASTVQPSSDGSVSNRRNSLAPGLTSRIPALNTSTQSRRNSLATATSADTRAPSTQARRSSLAVSAPSNQSRPTLSQVRRNSLAGSSIPTRQPSTQSRRNSLAPNTASSSAPGSSSRRQSTSSSISNSVGGSSSAVTGNPRPRYLDYAHSPRFAALKAQNLERRRLAEEKSRAHAAPTKASPRRPHASEASSSFTFFSASSLSSSTASSPCSSTSSASLASSLPPRTTRRLDQVRSRLFDFRGGGHPHYEDREGRTRLMPCAQARSQST